ncbi:MAG: T9SS type A sorting domain-containing protein [Ignavibacteriaceae bacterium]|nr:T9SS type A sorting domain-containing protein [Ignavibacteriaceae bacterium]
MYSSFDFGENFTTLKGCIIDGIVYGDTTTVGIEDEETPMATEFRLEQNYPNPFNPNTVISYQLPVISNVTLKVYDILGNEIATLVNEEKPAGTYEVEFNSHSGLSGIRDLPSGIYFYQLLVSAGRSPDGKAGSFVQTKKMVLLK